MKLAQTWTCECGKTATLEVHGRCEPFKGPFPGWFQVDAGQWVADFCSRMCLALWAGAEVSK